jgi:hypothetical protein
VQQGKLIVLTGHVRAKNGSNLNCCAKPALNRQCLPFSSLAGANSISKRYTRRKPSA